MSASRTSTSLSSGLILIVITVVLLLMAGSASAQPTRTTETNRSFQDATANPCNGEPVPFEGSERFTTSSSGTKLNIRYQFHGKGLGSVTGVQYSLGAFVKVNGNFPPGPVIIRSRNKVVSQGPTDNFFATNNVVLNADHSPGPTKIDSDCRG